MNDLRTAAQQALEALEAFLSDELRPYEAAKTSDALRAALAQQAEPVQEPVAWGVDWGRDGDRSCVSITKKRADGTVEVVAVEYGPLYTAPPQRKPLTEEEEIEACRQQGYAHAGLRASFDFGQAARAVERAHNITDPQIEDRLARHGIPMPEGNPK